LPARLAIAIRWTGKMQHWSPLKFWGPAYIRGSISSALPKEWYFTEAIISVVSKFKRMCLKKIKRMKMTFTNALSTRMIRQQMIDEKKQELTSKETRGRLPGRRAISYCFLHPDI